MKRSCAAALFFAVLSAACESGVLPPVRLSADEVGSPAAVDSGEPFLSSAGDTVFMSWLGRSASGVRQMRFARYVGGTWEEPSVVTEGERLLVNVADFPSVVPAPDGSLWAHWLQRDANGRGYGVRVTRSEDGGSTWSEPWIPHQDGTPTDHGFVSTVPLDGAMGLLWLDGRAFAPATGGAATMETALYFRIAGADGPVSAEAPLDLRVCDCCQTDAAVTSRGPVLVYRDRSPEEIRDIRVTRYENGSWGESRLVHEDGWETGACPINGPAVAAQGEDVAVAWFTAADEESRVNVAFSDDAAGSFGRPTRVDDGNPAGRVDVVLMSDGSALVSWLERTVGDGAEVRVRRVGPAGERLEALGVSGPTSERAMGFPRLAPVGDDAIIVAWTDGAQTIPQVRVTRIEIEVEEP